MFSDLCIDILQHQFWVLNFGCLFIETAMRSIGYMKMIFLACSIRQLKSMYHTYKKMEKITEWLDMMYKHLKDGTPLPPAQSIRAVPRGDKEYTEDNFEDLLPLPKMDPGGDAITFSRRVLHITK